jgi:formylmethanofuran dehydrogenase subunit B
LNFPEQSTKTSYSHACPACTCVCDDLEIVANEKSILEVSNACQMGVKWFENSRRLESPAFVDGKPADFNNAIAQAAERLDAAQAPLICGLDQLTTQGQQSAWRLAQTSGACIDTSLDNRNRSAMFALQRVGKVTSTLGEVAQRSDLVVFWFCDPVRTHPRHLERYSRPAGRPRKKIIVVDERKTETARSADQFIQLRRTAASAAVCTLRSLLMGIRLDPEQVLNQTESELKQWERLLQQLTGAKYGAVFTGKTTSESQFDAAADSMASLIRRLNDQTCIVSLSLRDDANAQSAENVLAWNSGFAMAVNAVRPTARSYWLESSAATILERGETDCVLLVTSEAWEQSLESLNPTARENLVSLPKILLSQSSDLSFENGVQFLVGRPGVDDDGEYCRHDDVPLPTRHAIVGVKRNSAKQVLDEIRQRFSQTHCG